MWLAGNKRPPLAVYLCSDGFSVARGKTVLHSRAGQGLNAIVETLRQWLLANPMRCDMEIYLSAALCRPFIANIPGILTGTEAEVAWQAAASLRTGFGRECRIWKEELLANGGQIAAAMETSTFQELLSLRNLGFRYPRATSIKPAWSEWLRVAMSKDPTAECVILHEPDAVSVLAGNGPQFETATSVINNGDGAWMRASIERLLLVAQSEGKSPVEGRLALAGVTKVFQQASALGPLLEEIL